jgi:tripartite ATP-independent transporter DctM subunit
MSPVEVGLLGIGFLLILIFAGMPVAFALALAGFLGSSYLLSVRSASALVAMTTYYTLSSYVLTVIPLFIWMGYLAYYSGLSKRLYEAAYSVVGQLRGGLAMATVMACAAFAAVAGSATATAATMGAISLPEMKRYRYSPLLSAPTVASGGILGILIPPSLILIIYGIVVEQSIGRLFMAGILPGLLLTSLFVGVIYLRTLRNPALGPPAPQVGTREKLMAIIKGGTEVLLIFVLVMGGFFAGFFTPTEAGAVGASSVLVLALIRRLLTWQGFLASVNDAIKTSAMVILLIAAGRIFTVFIAMSGIPVVVSEWVGALPLPPVGILLCVLLMHWILGCFIDSLALIIMTLPIFFPLIIELGFDPIWFGIVIVLDVGMGIITPPVAINVFVVSSVAKDIPVETIFKGIWPFVIALLTCSGLLIAFPQIALWLPNLLW